MTLAPSQALVPDMPSLLKQAGMEGFNGVFNLTFRTKAPDNALLLASGSVDQTGTYVFQVLPHEVRESMAKTISYWSTANGDDTMVTIWNPADEAQDLLFTIQYEGGSYVLPLHLEARATRLFNISSVIQDQLPDTYGHVIPATVTSGSARIAGTHADNERILIEIDSGIYNINKATCIYSCTSCDGALNALIETDRDRRQSQEQTLSIVFHGKAPPAKNLRFCFRAGWEGPRCFAQIQISRRRRFAGQQHT